MRKTNAKVEKEYCAGYFSSQVCRVCDLNTQWKNFKKDVLYNIIPRPAVKPVLGDRSTMYRKYIPIVKRA